MKLFSYIFPLFLFVCLFSTAIVSANDPAETKTRSDITAVLHLVRGSDNTGSGNLPPELNLVAAELSGLSGHRSLILEDVFIGRMNATGRLNVKGFTPAFRKADVNNEASLFELIITGSIEATDPQVTSIFFRQFHFNVQVPYKVKMTAPDGIDIPAVTRYNKVEMTSNNLTVNYAKPTLIGKLTTGFDNDEPYYLILTLKSNAD